MTQTESLACDTGTRISSVLPLLLYLPACIIGGEQSLHLLFCRLDFECERVLL